MAPYEGTWRTIVRQAKFAPAPAAYPWLAARLADALPSIAAGPGIWFVPAPASSRASVLRGPSLPWALARYLARVRGGQAVAALARRRPGTPQRQRGRDERATLTADTFACVAPVASAAAVVLVDDVMTTGATLLALASALRLEAPGVAVGAAVLARAGAPVEGAPPW